MKQKTEITKQINSWKLDCWYFLISGRACFTVLKTVFVVRGWDMLLWKHCLTDFNSMQGTIFIFRFWKRKKVRASLSNRRHSVTAQIQNCTCLPLTPTGIRTFPWATGVHHGTRTKPAELSQWYRILGVADYSDLGHYHCSLALENEKKARTTKLETSFRPGRVWLSHKQILKTLVFLQGAVLCLGVPERALGGPVATSREGLTFLANRLFVLMSQPPSWVLAIPILPKSLNQALHKRVSLPWDNMSLQHDNPQAKSTFVKCTLPTAWLLGPHLGCPVNEPGRNLATRVIKVVHEN